MKDMLSKFLLWMYLALVRGADSKTVRYYICNVSANFGQDLLDFVATILTIRANYSAGTIRDSKGNVYNISAFSLPTKLTNFIRSGRTYLFSSGKSKTKPLLEYEIVPTHIIEQIGVFASNVEQVIGLKAMPDEQGNKHYSYEIMSPDRMIAFYSDLGVKVESKCASENAFTHCSLSEFNTACDDSGNVYLVGGEFSAEESYLSGLLVPNSLSEYMRQCPTPTDEEMVTWLKDVFF